MAIKRRTYNTYQKTILKPFLSLNPNDPAIKYHGYFESLATRSLSYYMYVYSMPTYDNHILCAISVDVVCLYALAVMFGMARRGRYPIAAEAADDANDGVLFWGTGVAG